MRLIHKIIDTCRIVSARPDEDVIFSTTMSTPGSTQNPPPVIENTKQKLVTIYLDNTAYAIGKGLVGSFADKHGLVEEHLGPQLASGWHIKKIDGFGGNSDSLSVRGWIIVLLERD